MQKNITLEKPHNGFENYIRHCIQTSERLESRGNLGRAVDYRISAAHTLLRINDKDGMKKQYSMAASIYEKIAKQALANNYPKLATTNLERAAGLYKTCMDSEKTRECCDKAIELLNEQKLEYSRTAAIESRFEILDGIDGRIKMLKDMADNA